MSLVTNAEFNAVRDALVAAGSVNDAAWAAAIAPYAAKDDDFKSNLAGLRPAIAKEAIAKIPTTAISKPEVERVGAKYAERLAAGDLAAAAWTATKAAFPGYADATLEAHKAEALAHASDHPVGYPRG
jgi:hypothetical protein